MTKTTLQAVGQFAGDMPLTGYNVQKHSVNAAILRVMPTDTVRSAITHFGTRGLFGKVTRRTAQHDKDNERRKDSRDIKALKSKPNPYPLPMPMRKCRLSGDRSVSKANARGPHPPGREIVLDFRPHPLPSSSNIVISSSPPAHSTRNIPPTANEGGLAHDKMVSSHPKAVPGLRLADGALPMSANNCILPLPTSLSASGEAHPYKSSPTNVVTCGDPAVGSSLQYDASVNQDRTSLDRGYAPSMSTPPAGHTADPSRVPVVMAQVNSQVRVATLDEQIFNAAISNGFIVDPNVNAARVTEHLSPQGRLSHQRAPPYSNLDAPHGTPRSCYPFAMFADPDSPSSRPPPPSSHFIELGTAGTSYPSQATTDVYANEIGPTLAPWSATPAPNHCDASSIQDYTPPTNGCITSLWGSASCEREAAVPPPTTYNIASWSHPTYLPPNYTQMHVSTAMPSDDLANIAALVNYYTQPLSAPYIGDALLSSPPPNVGSPSGNVDASRTASGAIQWHATPGYHLASTVNQTSRAFSGDRLIVDANTSLPYHIPSSIETVDYAYAFDEALHERNPRWPAQSPPVNHIRIESAGRGWDDGGYWKRTTSSSSPSFRPTFPSPEAGEHQPVLRPY